MEVTCTEDGVITLRGLPIHSGESVEVLVIPNPPSSKPLGERFPLRGEPLEYLDPFEPVAEPDWASSK
jgi:hypothetical protein